MAKRTKKKNNTKKIIHTQKYKSIHNHMKHKEYNPQ